MNEREKKEVRNKSKNFVRPISNPHSKNALSYNQVQDLIDNAFQGIIMNKGNNQ